MAWATIRGPLQGREDYRAALVAQVVANVNRSRKHKPTAYKIDDFLLKWDPEAPKGTHRAQTVKEMRSFMRSFARRWNRRVEARQRAMERRSREEASRGD